jgi:hypothetical protein
MQLAVTDDWRADNDEDVGDSEDDQDDKKCALLLHPLTAADLTGDPHSEWCDAFTVSPEGDIGVVKPSGVSRPADWVGSGGLTPTGGDNDVWDVVGGSSAPKATLTLAERYTGRMERFFDHADDSGTGYAYHAEFGFIYNRANPPTDIEELLDPEEDRIPENIWHWKNRGAGRLDITAPKAGTVRLTVNYKEPVFDFPYTTNAGYNWGPDSPSTLSWSTGTVYWDIEVASGVNQVAFDLALPHAGNYDPQLHVVTSIEVVLPSAAENEQWAFSEVTLLANDPNALSKEGNENDHHVFQHYDPYQWASDFTGFRGRMSGRRIFAIPYGMEGRETVERSLKIRQMNVGYPSGLVFDYVKAAETTAGEIGYQEGLDCTYHDPEEDNDNKDANDDYMLGTFRAFDVRHVHVFQSDSSVTVTACPKAVSIEVPLGIVGLEGDENDEGVVIYYDKYPQGRYHGLAYKSDRTDRKRRDGTLYLWKRPLSGGAWVLADSSATPDRFGRFDLGPDKEKDWYYGVTDSDTSAPTSGSEFRNREAVWRTIAIPSGGRGLCCFDQLPHFLYVFYSDGGTKHVYTSGPGHWFQTHITRAHYAQPKQDSTSGDSSHTGYVDNAGRIRLYLIRDGAVVREDSHNWGAAWGASAVATPITSAEAVAVCMSGDRSRQHMVYISGGSFVYAYSHDHFTTVDGSSTITTGVDSSGCDLYEGQDGFIYAYCFKAGTIYCYSMSANGVWAEVGAV